MQRVSLFTGIFLLTTLFFIDQAECWGMDELEVFDVVEEVNQNFYSLLSVPEDADQGQIKKAFRRLSLVLHPDKSDAPDAELKFRQLVAVYDILKDSNKRKCYDHVLKNGLPDWKNVMFYYRRVRKMGLAELSVILFIIISIGQYLVGWAQYLEHKFTVEDYLSSKTKKLMKKQKKGKVDMTSANLLPPELDLDSYKPSIKNTLPFQLPKLFWFLLVGAPPLTYRFVSDYLAERKRRKLEAEEQEDSGDEEENVITVPRAPRRRKPGFTVPEINDSTAADADSVLKRNGLKTRNEPRPIRTEPPIVSGGLWTDDDLAELVKLVKKYPVGTAERWEKIGETMRRPATEVAHMAHKVKDNMVKSLSGRQVHKTANDSDADDDDDEDDEQDVAPQPDEEYIVPVVNKKVKTRGGKVTGAVGNSTSVNAKPNGADWSQVQQKALESALAKYPKGSASDRWEKIAKCVPGKSKEECMLRYKDLVEMVKKKKEQETTVACDGTDTVISPESMDADDKSVCTDMSNEDLSHVKAAGVMSS